MLLELVGFDGMDEQDRAAIRRLIEIKSRGEVPEPMHLCGSWTAVPTSDQAAVLEAFDLSGPFPVTMHLGAHAWNRDNHEWFGDDAYRRMYVTPAFDGWTLVFGKPIQPEGESESDEDTAMARQVQQGTRRLSERFGEAQWYGASCGGGWTSWCIARDGEIVRYYDAFDTADAIGDPLPVELPAVEEGNCDSTDVAAALSVNPEKLGPQTPVQGRAVLALTSRGRERGMPTGSV